MNIDLNTLQAINFDGHDVQTLVLNGVTLWTKGGSPSPGPVDYAQEYFTITSWEDSNTISFYRRNTTTNIYYSTDKSTWIQITGSLLQQSLNKGQSIYFKGTNDSLSTGNNTNRNCNIRAGKLFEVSGNIQSLLWGDNFVGKTDLPNTSAQYIFYGFFTNASTLLTARNLVLPITTYNNWIYEQFFRYCSSLIYAPKELPENTTQGRNTLIWMFGNCTSLQETPVVRLNAFCGGDSWKSYVVQNASGMKRMIFLLDSGYPSLPSGMSTSTGIFYKKSTNTSIGFYSQNIRDFSDNSSDYVHIWAETETPYDGYITGCSDYYKTGDSVTLVATAVNGTTFDGYYENGSLVCSTAEYTFTASSDRNLVVKYTT